MVTTCQICGKDSDNLNPKTNVCVECENILREMNSIFGDDDQDDEPIRYNHKMERSQVFNFLKSIGWFFNAEKEIWYDGKVKNEDGEFKLPFLK